MLHRVLAHQGGAQVAQGQELTGRRFAVFQNAARAEMPLDHGLVITPLGEQGPIGIEHTAVVFL